jgi:hypothetical protein
MTGMLGSGNRMQTFVPVQYPIRPFTGKNRLSLVYTLPRMDRGHSTLYEYSRIAKETPELLKIKKSNLGTATYVKYYG